MSGSARGWRARCRVGENLPLVDACSSQAVIAPQSLSTARPTVWFKSPRLDPSSSASNAAAASLSDASARYRAHLLGDHSLPSSSTDGCAPSRAVASPSSRVCRLGLPLGEVPGPSTGSRDCTPRRCCRARDARARMHAQTAPPSQPRRLSVSRSSRSAPLRKPVAEFLRKTS